VERECNGVLDDGHQGFKRTSVTPVSLRGDGGGDNPRRDRCDRSEQLMICAGIKLYDRGKRIRAGAGAAGGDRRHYQEEFGITRGAVLRSCRKKGG